MAAETEAPAAGLETIPAVPVHVGHDVNTQTQAADYGAWMTYATPAGPDVARPILPFDPLRHRAMLVVTASGAPNEITPANPAVATQFSYTLPYAASIQSLSFTYTASATVGTRYVVVQVTDAAGNVVYQVPTNSGTTAGTSIQAFLSNGGIFNLTAAFGSYAPISAQVWPAGYHVLITVSGGLPAGDQISGINMMLSASGGSVWVGTAAQCQASPPLGGSLPASATGAQVVVENNQSLWMVGDGTHAVTVAVLQERWDNDGV